DRNARSCHRHQSPGHWPSRPARWHELRFRGCSAVSASSLTCLVHLDARTEKYVSSAMGRQHGRFRTALSRILDTPAANGALTIGQDAVDDFVQPVPPLGG